MLPMSLYKEVTETDESIISVNAEFYEKWLGPHTHVGTDQGFLYDAIRGELTKNIGELLPAMQDESRFAWADVLQSKGFSENTDKADGWQALPAYDSVVEILTHIDGRVFLGLPLARDPEWLHSAKWFTLDVVAAQGQASRYNALVRYWFAGLLAPVRRVHQHFATTRRWMAPLIAEGLRADADLEKRAVMESEARGTWVNWMLRNMPERNGKEAEKLVIAQMIVRGNLLLRAGWFVLRVTNRGS